MRNTTSPPEEEELEHGVFQIVDEEKPAVAAEAKGIEISSSPAAVAAEKKTVNMNNNFMIDQEIETHIVTAEPPKDDEEEEEEFLESRSNFSQHEGEEMHLENDQENMVERLSQNHNFEQQQNFDFDVKETEQENMVEAIPQNHFEHDWDTEVNEQDNMVEIWPQNELKQEEEQRQDDALEVKENEEDAGRQEEEEDDDDEAIDIWGNNPFQHNQQQEMEWNVHGEEVFPGFQSYSDHDHDHDDVIFQTVDELHILQPESPVKKESPRYAEPVHSSPSELVEEPFDEQAVAVDTEEKEELEREEREEEERIEQEIFYSYEQERIDDAAFPIPRNTERIDVPKMEDILPEELAQQVINTEEKEYDENTNEAFFEEKEEEDDAEGVFFEEQDEEIQLDEADRKLMGLSFKEQELENNRGMNILDSYEPEDDYYMSQKETEKSPAMNKFHLNIPSQNGDLDNMLDVTTNTFFDFDREKLDLTERGSVRPQFFPERTEKSGRKRRYIAKTIWNTNEIYAQDPARYQAPRTKLPILSFVFEKFGGIQNAFNPKGNVNFCGDA